MGGRLSNSNVAMFSIKPFLKRFAAKPFLKRLVITPDRAFGQAFRRKGCDQTFFEKACGKREGKI
ncbi:MAG TPA: hypothetical protein VGK06_00620 [Methanosarcina sp.]